jgi:hypothetical protein
MPAVFMKDRPMLCLQQLRTESAARPELMTSWQRRTLLLMLLALFALLNVAFNHAGPTLDLVGPQDSAHMMLGGFFAQACLLAVWAALGRQPLARRVPGALGVAALLGLSASWGEARHRLDDAEGFISATLMMVLVGLQAMLLIPWRRCFQWRIHTSADASCSQSSQFSLKQLLLWTTAAAVILALARAIGLRHVATVSDLTRLAAESSICLIVAVVCLPLVIPGIALILGNRKRGRAAAWLAVAIVVSTVALFLTLLLLFNSEPWTEAAWGAAGGSVGIEAGFLAALLLGLMVARLCGFRLSRGASDAMASEQALALPTAQPPVEPAPWWRSRFAYVVVLAWPAWSIELERRENLQHAAIYREWDQLGVDVAPYDYFGYANFDPQRPVSDLALDKLKHSRQAQGIRRLQFSNTSLTDDQMQYLAGFKDVESLLLDGTQITDAGLVHLRGMRKLRVLNLNGTRVSDEGLKILEGMDSLEELGLNDTAVGDAGPVHLPSLPRLTALGLARTRVTDDGLQPVQELPKLQVIMLQGTSVTAAGLARLPLSQLNPVLSNFGSARPSVIATSPIVADTSR